MPPWISLQLLLGHFLDTKCWMTFGQQLLGSENWKFQRIYRTISCLSSLLCFSHASKTSTFRGGSLNTQITNHGNCKSGTDWHLTGFSSQAQLILAHCCGSAQRSHIIPTSCFTDINLSKKVELKPQKKAENTNI